MLLGWNASPQGFSSANRFTLALLRRGVLRRISTHSSTCGDLPEHQRSGSEDIIEKEEVMNSFNQESKNNENRRQFLKNGMVAAGAATLG